MSPYLFVLVMEYLTRVFSKLRSKPYFNYHARCEKLNILNLCFADDLLMFARGNPIYLQLLINQFGRLSNATRLVEIWLSASLLGILRWGG